MSIEHRIGPEGRDDDVTRELRRLYAAPADDAYWQGLQERILASLTGRPAATADGWWVALERWSRVGALVAPGSGTTSCARWPRGSRSGARARYASRPRSRR